MRDLLCPWLVSGLLAACGGTSGSSSPTTIHVTTTALAPELVAFRDGIEGPWQTATMKTPTSFELVVHHPYVVAVVCRESTVDPVTLSQIARSPEESHDVSVRCGSLDEPHRVTGHMVQVGQLTMGSTTTISKLPEWDFSFEAVPGSYDLVARTDTQIVVRRGITITSDDVALTPAVDLAQEGTAFAMVAFSAANAAADEAVSALAYVTNPTLTLSADLPEGPITAVKVAPASVLEPSDTQSVQIRASRGSMTRSLLRPFPSGGDTLYTLPPAIGDLQWKVEGGQLSASWTSLPDLDQLTMFTFGAAGGTAGQSFYELTASAQFLATTAVEQLGFDTGIPGFKAEWRIDFAGGYQRYLEARRNQSGVVAVTWDGVAISAAARRDARSRVPR
jgi:hypothetical protein